MRRYYIIFGFISLVAIQDLSAYIYLPIVKSFGKAEYGAGRQNWDIGIDSYGVVYFGNTNGLLRNIYGIWQLTPTSNNDVVRSLCVDNDTIWTGGDTEYGYFVKNNPKDLSYIQVAELGVGSVWNIQCLESIVYFQTEGAVNTYNKQTKEKNSVVAGTGFFDIKRWKNEMWAITRDGKIGIIDKNTFTSVDSLTNFNGTEVREMYVHNDQLHILLFDGRIYSFDGETLNEVVLPNEIAGKAFFSATSYNEDVICIGTISDGLVQVDQKKNQIITWVNSSNELIDNTVLSIARDPNGNVWLGLDYGIAYVELQSAIKPIFNQGATYFIEDYNNSTYLATNKGLYFSSGMYPFTLFPSTEGQVWRLRLINDELYICHNVGLMVLNNQSLDFAYSDDGVMDVANFSGTDYFLISAYSGLLLAKSEKGKITIVENLNFWGNPKIVYDDANKCIWADTRWGSVSRFSLKEDLSVKRKDYADIKTFFYNHGKFLFYNGAELLKYENNNFEPKLGSPFVDIKGDSLTKFAMDEDEKIVAYLQKDNLNLLVNLPDGNYYSYGKMLSSITGSLIKNDEFIDIHNNELRIATDRGVLTFATNAKSKLAQNSNPVIAKVVVAEDEKYKTEFTYPYVEESIFLPVGDKDILFYFGSNKSSSNVLEFRYRLWPYDKDWSNWNAEINQKEYTKLSGGVYKFSLQSRLNGGNIKEQTLSVIIEKHWYQTKWVILFYALIFIIGIVLTVRIMNRRNRIKLLKEKEKHKRHIVKKTIDIKNEQLLQYAEVISRKNEFLIELKEGLARMRNTEAKRWENRILDEVNNEKKNFFFHKLFSELHQDFINRLTEKYPDLTANDVRLLSFIRINLETKEIASLLNISTKSVDINRYRIRKKMNLPHETDLNVFIRDL